MSHQMDLFGKGQNQDESERSLPYQSHSPTSKEAATEAKRRASALRRKVFEFIRSKGKHGATDDEIQVGLELEGSTQRPRRVELVNDSSVVPSGRYRQTRSGRKATVWVASEYQ